MIVDKRPQEKKCPKCSTIKPYSDFYDKKRAKARADGSVYSWLSLYFNCKKCVDHTNNIVRPRYAAWYAEYRVANKEKISAKTKRHYVSTKAAWWELVSTKMDLKCSDCGYDHHTSAFDFHHLDPSMKDFGIHSKFRGVPTAERWAEVSKEIDRCVLLCANCHRIRHSQYNFVEKIVPKMMERL